MLPEIGFYFTDRAPLRAPTILRLGSQGIDIPPGESRYVIRDSYVLPVDVQLLAVQPHAHYRAKEIRGVAHAAGRHRRALVMHIKDWDFRWQHVYREETPIPLPKGTRLSMEYTYDNSASNVRNPELPPARVFWGQRSRDEMGDLWFQLLASNDADRARMSAEITAKMTGEDIVGYETMLKVTPNDAELHDDVALLYLGMGFAANAVRHFQASAALKPESAAAHFNLGTALAQAGRFDDSVEGVSGRAVAPARLRAGARQSRTRAAGEGRCAGGAQALPGSGAARSEQSAKPAGTVRGARRSAAHYDLAIEMLERAMKLPLNEGLAKEIFAKRAALPETEVASPATGSTSATGVDDLLDQRLRAAPTSAVPAGTTTPCRRDRSSRRSASSRRRTSGRASSLTGADTVFIHG